MSYPVKSSINYHKNYTIFDAVHYDDVDFISNNLKDIYYYGSNTVLYTVIVCKSIKCFRYLIDLECNVFGFHKYSKDNLLMVAARQKECEASLEICEVLLKAGVSYYDFSFKGYNALFYAINFNNMKTACMIIDYANTHSEKRYFIEWINSAYKGYTAMTIAIQNNSPSMVKFLIEMGFDIKRRRDDVRPFLDLAIYRKCYSIVKILLSYGVCTDYHKDGMYKPIFQAIKQAYEVIPLLVRYGANINEVDEYGDSVLDYAQRIGTNSICYRVVKDLGGRSNKFSN